MVKAPSVGSYFVKSVVSVYVSVPDELSLHVLPCADRQSLSQVSVCRSLNYIFLHPEPWLRHPSVLWTNGKCLEIKGQSVPAHFTPPTIIKMGYYFKVPFLNIKLFLKSENQCQLFARVWLWDQDCKYRRHEPPFLAASPRSATCAPKSDGNWVAPVFIHNFWVMSGNATFSWF